MKSKLLLTFLFLGLLANVNLAFAIDYYWVGGANNDNWNNHKNWTTVAGSTVGGGFGIPQAGYTDNGITYLGDDVHFVTGSAPCDITNTVNVESIDVLADYTGTIRHLSNANLLVTDFTMSGGFFIGSPNVNRTMTVRGGLTLLTGGTFTAGNTMLLSGVANHIFYGTFNHNGGTVEIRGNSTIIGNPIFNNLKLNAPGTRVFNIANTMTVENDLTLDGIGNLTINVGRINLTNSASLTCLNSGTATSGTSIGTIGFTGTGNQRLIGNIAGSGRLPNIIIEKSGGTLTLENTITLANDVDWTYVSGTLNAGTSNLVVSNSGTEINGTQTLNNLSFNPSTVGNHNYTIGSTVTLNGNLTFAGITGSNITLYNGTLDAKKDIQINNGSLSSNGTGTISITGSLDQTINATAASGIPNLYIEKSTGILNIANNINVGRNLSMVIGDINLNNNTLTLGTAVTNTTTRGILSHLSGRMYNGTFTRWYGANNVTNLSSAALFPIGTAQEDRSIYISTTSAPTTGGTISVMHDASAAAASTDLTDGTKVLKSFLPSAWNISANGVAGGTFDLRIQGENLSPINNLNDIRLVQTTGAVGTHGSTSGSTSNPTITRTGLTAANLTSTFRIGSTEVITPLPVELISFKAEKAEKAVNVIWATASEKNNAYFIVERSADGKNFATIGQVEGAGTTNTAKNYAFLDKNPLNNISYYRLKQVDLDGTFEYSQIVKVMVTNRALAISLNAFPNPTADKVNVQITGLIDVASLHVFDLAGRMVTEQNLAKGANTAEISLAKYPAGMYQVKLVTANGTSFVKVIKN